MPPVAGAAVAALGAGLAQGFTAAVLVKTFAISLALGFVQQALAPKPKSPRLGNLDDRGSPQMVRSSIEPHQVIYGTAKVSGPLAFAEVTGANKQYLHLVVPLAGHEVTGIDSVFFNDIEIAPGALDGAGNVVSGRFAGHARIKKHLGGDGQTADSSLVAEVANWTNAHRGRGVAYLYLRLKWNRDVYPTGIPNVTAVVRGRKVWDPRSDPGDPAVKSYSTSAALCALDYAMAGFGFGAPLSEIHEASWVAAANVCDEAVGLKAGGTQARYDCNGAFQIDDKPLAIMDDLLTAMGGTLVYQQGAFRGYAAAATVASGSLDESDLRGELRVVPRPSRSQSFNAVRGSFVDADDGFLVTDFPPVTNATYQAEDAGVQVFKEIELPFTTNKARAQRIGSLHLHRARQGITVQFPAKLNKFALAPWDVVTVSIARLGWSNKEFRVLEWALAEDGGVDLTLQEEAAAVYAWDPQDEIATDPAPDTNLPDPFTVEPLTGLAVASGSGALFLKADGTVVSRIKASWDAPGDLFVSDGGQIEVQAKKSADADWRRIGLFPGDAVEVFVFEVEDGIAYDVRVRAVNSLGVRSAFTTASNHVVVGKSAPPADVTGFTAAQNGAAMNFRWDQVADLDLAGYEIRFNPQGATAWGDATRLTEVTRGTAITNAQVPPGDWTFLIKAKDTSGNESMGAARADAEMVAADFNIIHQAAQAPRWLGTLSGFVRHHSGVLVPDSQNLASDDGFETFDSFVPNPVASATYEAPAFDVDFDDTVRVWADIASALGPGETTGVADPALQIDYRKDSGAFDGFEPWTIGNIDARFVKFRLALDTAKGLAKVTGFKPTVDLFERTEGAKGVIVGAGGQAFAFARAFHVTPRVAVTVDGTTALIATKENVTTTGFTAHVFSAGGSDVGGTVDWQATGA